MGCHLSHSQVQKLQNFSAKVALGGGAKRDHATPFLKHLGWLNIENKHKYELGLMIYNTLKGNIPNHLMSLPTVRDIRPLPTRQQHQLYIPKTKTNMGERSVLVAGPKLWNSLPTQVRNVNTLSSFKRQLYKYLLHHQLQHQSALNFTLSVNYCKFLLFYCLARFICFSF